MTNKNYPLVSVVIPTYNHAEFLRRALTSIVLQKYSNWEIIVIDNHSKDHTDEVVYSFKSHNIRLLKIQNNGIIAASRNVGINNANGEWIAFMDSDDIWYDSRLNTCIPYLNFENKDADIISTNELMVFNMGSKKKVLRHGPASTDMYRGMILYGNRLSPSATMVRKTFLERNNLRFSEDPKFVSAEDYEFWLRAAKHKASFIFLNSVEGEYTIHSGNTSSEIDKHISAINNVLETHVFELQSFEQNKSKLWRRVQSRIYLTSCLKKYRKFHVLRATILLFMSVSSSPYAFINVIMKKLWLKKILKKNYK